MDFKNILNQLDSINVDVKAPKRRPLSTSNATKQTLTESVAVTTKSSRPSLKDVFNTLMENDVTMEPVKAGAMAIKSGDATIGTAHTPAAANQMKQAIDKGEISLGGDEDEMNESDEDAKKSGKKEMSDKQKKFFGKKKESVEEARSPQQIMKDRAKDKADVKRDDKAEKAGKEVAKDAKYDGRKHPGKDGKEVAKDIEYDEWKEKKLPSISRIKKMCKDGLNQTEILKLHSMCDKQKLKDMIKKCKTNLKEGVDHILKAAKHMGKSHGLCKGGYACPHETGSEGHRAYHEGYVEGLDECMGIRNEPVLGMVDETEGKVVDTMASYGAMGEDETYEGNAFTGALASTAKGDTFKVGGNTYKDTSSLEEANKDAGDYDKYDWNASTKADRTDEWAFESLEAELNSLLNEDKVEEGVNISVQSGMEGQEDRVSVNATDAEADKLIQFVKSVGMGNYGDPEMDAEVIEPGEVSFYGSEAPSDEPQGSHDDMLKLMGIVDMGDEGEEDYADEETTDSHDEHLPVVIDADSEEEMCEACGSKMTNEGCGCSKTDEGAQYGPDDGSHNSNNDMQGNADANASLAANDADTPQLVKEKHESEAEEDDHAEEAGAYFGGDVKDEDEADDRKDRKEHDYSDDMHEDQGYDDKEDESLGMRDGKESDKDDDEAGRRDQSKGDYGTRTNEDEHLKEMMAMLSEVGSEASEEPTQPLSQHDDDNLTTEGAEDAPADDLDGSIEPVTETQTEDQKEFAVAESEEEELTEWANDAGKNGTDTSFEQDIDFMTKVISGGLNKQKSTGQTTIPVIAGQNDRTGYNGADLVKEGSVMSHDGLAGLMNRLDYLSK